MFLERDQPWYAQHRDSPNPDFCRLVFYRDRFELERCREPIVGADAVIVGSYVAGGRRVGECVQRTAQGVTAFYDIDTPVTLAKLARGDCEYLAPELIPGYDLYLSFTGGPTLAASSSATARPRRGRSIARSTRSSTDPARRSHAGISAISAPTAPTASRRSNGC